MFHEKHHLIILGLFRGCMYFACLFSSLFHEKHFTIFCGIPLFYIYSGCVLCSMFHEKHFYNSAGLLIDILILFTKCTFCFMRNVKNQDLKLSNGCQFKATLNDDCSSFKTLVFQVKDNKKIPDSFFLKVVRDKYSLYLYFMADIY